MRLILAVLPGVLDSGIGVTLDIANAANRLAQHAGGGAVFEVCIATPDGRAVSTGNGLSLSKVGTLPTPGPNDVIVLPGAMVAEPDQIADWMECAEVQAVVRWLRQEGNRARCLAAGCTGVFVLAEAGLLDGLSATTSWWLAASFCQRYPQVRLEQKHMVVDAGRCITAGAALAQADLMLRLVARFASPRLSRQCSRFLLIDARPLQSSYLHFGHLLRQDPFLQRAEAWLSARMVNGFTVAELAAALNVSSRTLSRRLKASIGMSPVRLVQRMRVERAVHLLETTDLALGEIAQQAGYADIATLRRLLQREHGASPAFIRARVRQVAVPLRVTDGDAGYAKPEG